MTETGTPMALPKRFGSNVFMQYVTQGASGLAALAITPLLLHRLGQSAFGIWILASGVVGYLELFELGFGGAAIKLIAEDANVRPARAVSTLNTAFFVLVPLGLLALGVGLLIAFFSPSLFSIPHGLQVQAVAVFALLAAGLAASIPGDSFGGALMGFQRYDLLNLANTGLIIVSAAVTVAVLLGHGGLVPLALATTIASIAFHGVRWWMLRKVFPQARLGLRLVDLSRLRDTIQMSGWFFVNAVAVTVCSNADIVVVGILFGARTTAIYAVGFKLAQVATQALGSLIYVLIPHASATARNQGDGALEKVTIDGTRVGLFASILPALLLMVLAYPLVHAWVGSGYGKSAQIVVVLTSALLAGSFISPLSMVLYGAGRVQINALIRTVEGCVNLTLSILLAHIYGPIGVALGTLGGVVLIRLPGTLIIGTRSIGLSLAPLLRRGILPHLLPSIACTAVLLLAIRSTFTKSIPGLILTGCIGVSVYALGYYFAGAPAHDRAAIRDGARRAIRALRRTSRDSGKQ